MVDAAFVCITRMGPLSFILYVQIAGLLLLDVVQPRCLFYNCLEMNVTVYGCHQHCINMAFTHNAGQSGLRTN